MAAEGRRTLSDVILTDTHTKIFRLTDGALLAVGGEDSHASAIIEALEGEDEELPHAPGDVHALLVEVDGTISLFDGSGDFVVTDADCIAIGSGSAFAYGAMEMGATAEEAVEVATRRDPQSGGLIQVLHLEEDE